MLVREVDKTFKAIEVWLPTHPNGDIAYDYMIEYIKELEAYLLATGLNNYSLTAEEDKLINAFRNGGSIRWGLFNVEALYGKSTRGKRLKSMDRIPGKLPFVIAALHKSAYNGRFDYSKNFYAKDADELEINLPTKSDKTPDYNLMNRYIRAIEKLIIRGVVEWKGKQIAISKQVREK